jgi:hypothetical protein
MRMFGHRFGGGAGWSQFATTSSIGRTKFDAKLH